MKSQLDELQKWSETFTRSAWDSFLQMLKGFQAPAAPAAPAPADNLLKQLQQLNQFTLSAMEQFHYWEKLNEQIVAFGETAAAGLNLKPDNRVQELEDRIDELKSRLNEQEKILRDLQIKLQNEEQLQPNINRTSKILSDFLSEQRRQFNKLAEPDR